MGGLLVQNLYLPENIIQISHMHIRPFVRVFFLRLLMANFLVMRPKKFERIDGRFGGIVLHAASQVLLTHSSESSLFISIFHTIAKQ